VETLARARLYAILDLGYVEPSRAEDAARALLEGGADVLQLRGKKQSISKLRALAEKLHHLTSAAGADYIGFGPLFATPTKPDYQPIGTGDIRRVHELVQLPIFCIGGIKRRNLGAVLNSGASRVVIVSDLLQSADIAIATRETKALLSNLN